MGKLFSNIPLSKKSPATAILQMYVTQDGIFQIEDKTTEVYSNKKELFRRIFFTRGDLGEYVVALGDPSEDGIVLGLYVIEGTDISIETTKDPIFVMKNSGVELNLESASSLAKKAEDSIVGVFLPGTKIRYKKNGTPFTDVLEKNGWKRVSGNDLALRKKSNDIDESKMLAEIDRMLKEKEITKDLYRRLKVFIEKRDDRFANVNGVVLNFLSKDEVVHIKKLLGVN